MAKILRLLFLFVLAFDGLGMLVLSFFLKNRIENATGYAFDASIINGLNPQYITYLILFSILALILIGFSIYATIKSKKWVDGLLIVMILVALSFVYFGDAQIKEIEGNYVENSKYYKAFWLLAYFTLFGVFSGISGVVLGFLQRNKTH